MDWKDIAIDDLKSLKGLRVARDNVTQEINIINSKLYNIKAIDYSKDVVDGGDVQAIDDRRILDIVKKDKLQKRYLDVSEEIKLIEKGLSNLKADELKVLEYFFIDKPSRHIDKLMDELNCEKSQVYRIKNAALTSYVSNRYGLINL